MSVLIMVNLLDILNGHGDWVEQVVGRLVAHWGVPETGMGVLPGDDQVDRLEEVSNLAAVLVEMIEDDAHGKIVASIYLLFDKVGESFSERVDADSQGVEASQARSAIRAVLAIEVARLIGERTLTVGGEIQDPDLLLSYLEFCNQVGLGGAIDNIGLSLYTQEFAKRCFESFLARIKTLNMKTDEVLWGNIVKHRGITEKIAYLNVMFNKSF